MSLVSLLRVFEEDQRRNSSNGRGHGFREPLADYTRDYFGTSPTAPSGLAQRTLGKHFPWDKPQHHQKLLRSSVQGTAIRQLQERKLRTKILFEFNIY